MGLIKYDFCYILGIKDSKDRKGNCVVAASAGEGTFVDVFLPSGGQFSRRKHVYNGVSEALVVMKQLPITGLESLMPDI